MPKTIAGKGSKKNASAKGKILVIEDERPLAHAVELKLTNEGYETRLAHDGEEGLAAVGEFKPALIILDLVMPKLDGFGVLEELKRRKINVPVMVVSSLGQPEDEKRVRALGAKDFLPKSRTPLSVIVEKIKSLLP